MSTQDPQLQLRTQLRECLVMLNCFSDEDQAVQDLTLYLRKSLVACKKLKEVASA